MGTKTIRIAQVGGSVAVIAGALGYLLSTSMSDAMEYYHPVAVVMTKSAEMKGQRMRMGGLVQDGTIAQKPGTLEYIFEVKPIPREAPSFAAIVAQNPGIMEQTLQVRFNGVVPDTFKEGNEVIVTGELGTDGVFYAKDMTAKCPSKYEAAAKNEGTY
jgi:cytochrome c-type biogenesis protein CcmE